MILGTMHLLIIEDDPRLAELLAQLLTGERHVVEVARTGRDGIDLATANGLDAIVLDVGLPDISGIDVARRLRELGSTVPILMLTARDMVADRVRGLDAGADTISSSPSHSRSSRRGCGPSRGGPRRSRSPRSPADPSRSTTSIGRSPWGAGGWS